MDFPGVATKVFPGGLKLTKVRFNHLKLRKQPFFNFDGARPFCPSPSDAHEHTKTERETS